MSEEAFLEATGKTEAEMSEQFRPQALTRAKSVLVLAEIARVKGVEVSDAEVEAEVQEARASYANDRDMVQYFDSERGRGYIRTTIRRSRTVEQLVDEWLATHPEAPRLRHREEARASSPVRPRRPRPPPRSHRSGALDAGRLGGRVSQLSREETIRCSCLWSSSHRAVASAPTTSTRAFCVSGSSSWAMRSRTTSPTS